MGEWTEAQLGDLLRVEHGFAFKGEFFADDGEWVLLTPKNFRPEGGVVVSHSRLKRYSGPVDEKFLLAEGDIVVAMTDLTQKAAILGSSGVIPKGGVFLHNQRIGKVIVTDESRLSKAFAPHLLNSELVRQSVRGSATGSTVRHTAPRRIEDVRVSIPDLPSQEKIASLVAALDQIIGTNDRRIELLEHLARSLYREWFVHFRFPGHEKSKFKDSEVGVMPEDWEVAELADLAGVVVDGVDPVSIEPDVPYIGLEHMGRRRTTLTDWGSPESVKSRKLIFREGDTLFGKIRPYFHKVVWAPFDGVASSDAVVFRASADFPGPATVALITSSDQFVAEAVAGSNGTKMPRADTKGMLAFRLAVPPPKLAEQFERQSRSIFDACASLLQQSRTLASTRDLLLPRLVTGKLDITDIDFGVLEPKEAA